MQKHLCCLLVKALPDHFTQEKIREKLRWKPERMIVAFQPTDQSWGLCIVSETLSLWSSGPETKTHHSSGGIIDISFYHLHEHQQKLTRLFAKPPANTRLCSLTCSKLMITGTESVTAFKPSPALTQWDITSVHQVFFFETGEECGVVSLNTWIKKPKKRDKEGSAHDNKALYADSTCVIISSIHRSRPFELTAYLKSVVQKWH